MAQEKKPPLGVPPYWFVYLKRIKELNEAVGRHAEYIEANQHTEYHSAYYGVIAQWAKEIEALALLLADIEKSGLPNSKRNT